MRTCGECGVSIEGRHGRARFCSDRCRKLNHGAAWCEVCGKRTGWGTPPPTHCAEHNPSYEKAHERERQRILTAQKLRKQGLLNYEIAERMGSTQWSIATLLKRPNVARHGLEHVPTSYGPTRGRRSEKAA